MLNASNVHHNGVSDSDQITSNDMFPHGLKYMSCPISHTQARLVELNSLLSEDGGAHQQAADNA